MEVELGGGGHRRRQYQPHAACTTQCDLPVAAPHLPHRPHRLCKLVSRIHLDDKQNRNGFLKEPKIILQMKKIKLFNNDDR